MGVTTRFKIAFWCTDKFNAYNILPKDKHLVGKSFIQRIEYATKILIGDKI
ncbi:IS1 family transposase [Xenorhabdus sp. TS4]|uniref:IS1 family transposase n=1 Tax=Xenorhabdus sp. TS4 TaxID=1873483 RepID=UPI0016572402